MGFENNFNGIYFHHHFYLKTGVSRNGLSPGYSERDISSVYTHNTFISFIKQRVRQLLCDSNNRIQMPKIYCSFDVRAVGRSENPGVPVLIKST